LGVSRGVDRNQRVIAVVASEHEHAHQRLVIVRCLAVSLRDQIEQIEPRREPERGQGTDIVNEGTTS
jgi:hypothetical protein